MFSNARQLFVYENGENPTLKIGNVETISQPVPKYPTSYISPYGQNAEMIVDIKARFGDEPMEFKQLPASQGVFSYNGVIVTDSRDAMNAELENVIRKSQAVLDSVPMHEREIQSCNKFLMELNPQFAKDRKQEERIAGMESRMGGIEDSLKSIQKMLSSALGDSKN